MGIKAGEVKKMGGKKTHVKNKYTLHVMQLSVLTKKGSKRERYHAFISMLPLNILN
jgi:hypothetical protein